MAPELFQVSFYLQYVGIIGAIQKWRSRRRGNASKKRNTSGDDVVEPRKEQRSVLWEFSNTLGDDVVKPRKERRSVLWEFSNTLGDDVVEPRKERRSVLWEFSNTLGDDVVEPRKERRSVLWEFSLWRKSCSHLHTPCWKGWESLEHRILTFWNWSLRGCWSLKGKWIDELEVEMDTLKMVWFQVVDVRRTVRRVAGVWCRVILAVVAVIACSWLHRSPGTRRPPCSTIMMRRRVGWTRPVWWIRTCRAVRRCTTAETVRSKSRARRCASPCRISRAAASRRLRLTTTWSRRPRWRRCRQSPRARPWDIRARPQRPMAMQSMPECMTPGTTRTGRRGTTRTGRRGRVSSVWSFHKEENVKRNLILWKQ